MFRSLWLSSFHAENNYVLLFEVCGNVLEVWELLIYELIYNLAWTNLLMNTLEIKSKKFTEIFYIFFEFLFFCTIDFSKILSSIEYTSAYTFCLCFKINYEPIVFLHHGDMTSRKFAFFFSFQGWFVCTWQLFSN